MWEPESLEGGDGLRLEGVEGVGFQGRCVASKPGGLGRRERPDRQGSWWPNTVNTVVRQVQPLPFRQAIGGATEVDPACVRRVKSRLTPRTATNLP